MTSNRWILLIACLAGGLGALHYGFSLEWDLLNYHLYDPHALLSGRMAIDVAPAQQQTYLNPALFIPMYLVFKTFGTAVLVFIIGAIQAGQLLLLWLILQELTGHRIREWWMLLLVAALGLGGPIFLNQLGGSQGDTLLSVLVLAGLLAVMQDLARPDDSNTLYSGILAGVLIGMACALKLTFSIYALSLGLAAFLCFSGTRRWRMVLGIALGGVLGIGLAGGAWFVYQWQIYGNPLFPYFNNLFDSHWIGQGDYRDLRFMPGSTAEWILYPYYWLMDPQRVWEFSFRDLRVPLVITVAFLLPLLAWRKMREQAPALRLVLIFIGLSYLSWIRLFSIYRYLSVVELLAPVVIFSSVVLLNQSRRVLLITLVALIGSQALVEYHRGSGTWEFQPGTATRLDDLPADAMVLIDGYEPVAYAALWLNDDVPLVRIRANFMRTTEAQHKLHAMAHQAVRQHPGSFFLLLSQADVEAGFLDGDLAQVGLRLPGLEACTAVFDSEGLQGRLGLKLCRLEIL